ncbi:hypothetical protein LCM08_06340 [Salipiger pacificus]|nr:hypothetical protein [Alloyangia pacifica]
MNAEAAAKAEARIARRIEAAEAGHELGFASKAAQKTALDHLNRAYEGVRDQHFSATIEDAPEEQDARNAHFAAWEIPFDLHHVRDRHVDRLAGRDEARAARVRYLIELRAAIKAAPIVKIVKTDDAEKALIARVQSSIVALMEQRKAQYAEGLRLVEIFGNLPVSVSVHMVTNQFGTTFPRCFYYMNGKLTALNVILAVLQDTTKDDE